MDEAATSTSRSGDEDGAAAEQERSAPAAAVSFSIQRRSGPAMVARQGEGGGGGQSDKDFVLSLEGKEIQRYECYRSLHSPLIPGLCSFNTGLYITDQVLIQRLVHTFSSVHFLSLKPGSLLSQ